jgi:hypothetical protein
MHGRILIISTASSLSSPMWRKTVLIHLSHLFNKPEKPYLLPLFNTKRSLPNLTSLPPWPFPSDKDKHRGIHTRLCYKVTVKLWTVATPEHLDKPRIRWLLLLLTVMLAILAKTSPATLPNSPAVVVHAFASLLWPSCAPIVQALLPAAGQSK